MGTFKETWKILYPQGYNSLSYGTYLDCSRSGSTNPDYKVLLAQHKDASSAYSRVDAYYKGPGIATAKSRSGSNIYTGRQASPGGFVVRDPSLITRPDLDDIAIKRLKSRLGNDVQQFKALVPLGEIKETRELLKSTAKVTEDLLKGLIALKHGRTKDIVSAASNAWLQFSFAISPTINDINDLLATVDSSMNRQDWIGRYTGVAEDSWKATYNGGSYYTTACPGFGWQFVKQSETYHYRVKYTAGVDFKLRSSNSYSVADQFGLNFGEIIPTFWELVPFSWVADYFGTMGDFLSDVFESKAGDTIYVTKSVKTSIDCVSDYKLRNLGQGYIPVSNSGPGFHKHGTSGFYRTVLASLPTRSLRLKSIDEVGANSVKRLLNLGALLLSK